MVCFYFPVGSRVRLKRQNVPVEENDTVHNLGKRRLVDPVDSGVIS